MLLCVKDMWHPVVGTETLNKLSESLPFSPSLCHWVNRERSHVIMFLPSVVSPVYVWLIAQLLNRHITNINQTENIMTCYCHSGEFKSVQVILWFACEFTCWGNYKSFLLSFDSNDPLVSKETVRAFLMRAIHT